MSTTQQKVKGFTIVELLIVIVVIGILAAITIVAYNGIRQRAVTTAYTSAVDSWEKILRMEAATNELPPNTVRISCLGKSAADFPQTAEFEAGQCARQIGGDSDGVGWKYDDTFYDGWGSERQKGLLPTTTLAIPGEEGVLKSRGVLGMRFSSELLPSLGFESVVQWLPQVSGQCGRGESDNLDGLIPEGSLTGGMCVLYIGKSG